VNETLPNWTEQKTQALDAVGAVNKIETKVRPMPGKEFASVSYQGSKALVSLNSSHSQVDQVKDKKESKEVLEGVAVAFDLAQRLISEEESNEVQHALDRFRTEFSRQLRNLPNQRL
jgi:formylmethanofuran:tetrahydromethanopterin formyltransferase